MSRVNPKYNQKDRSGKAAYQAARQQAKMDRRVMTRTSYNSIIERSPASMIATGWGRAGDEKKFVDKGEYATAYPVYDTPSFVLLNGTETGSAFYNRIGAKVTMKSIHVKVKVSPRVPTVAPTGNNQLIRMMLVYDRQTNGAMPQLNTILADWDFEGTSTTGMMSGMNPTQTGRFVILREHWIQQFNVNNVAGLVGSANSLMEQDGQWWVNWFVKLKDLETVYQASTGGIGDIQNGGLYLIMFGDAAASEQACAEVQYQARLRFVG